MPIVRPSYSVIQNRMEQDVVASTGVNLPNTSVIRYFSRSQSKEIVYLWDFLAWVALQSNPGTATDVYLEEWASLKSITRNTATLATGSIILTGTANTSIPAGTVLQRSDGFTYTTNEVSTVGNAIPITATTSGPNGNAIAGTTLTLLNPITGVNSSANLVSAITNGSAMEPDDALRVRMKDAFRVRSVGGSAQDHVDWALGSNVGVTQAWCATTPVIPGQVVLYVMMDRNNSYMGFPQGTNGLSPTDTRWTAATGDQLAVAKALDSSKPVTEMLYVSSPVRQNIDFKITMSGATSTIETAVQAALRNLLLERATPLGTTVTNTTLIAVIANAAGTSNFKLTSPTTDITTAIGYLPVLNSCTFN